MKTIKKGNEIKRVSDKEVENMVGTGWIYCPKSEYKNKKK